MPIYDGVGVLNPYASLQLDDTGTGTLLNRMNTADRTTFGGLLGAGDDAMLVYDTDLSAYYYWDGSAWLAIVTSGGTSGTDVTLTPGSDTRNVVQPTGDFIALVVKNNAAQAKAPLQGQTSAGALLWSFDIAGRLTLAGAPGLIKPSSNSITALQIAQADNTAWVNFDTTNKRVEIVSNGSGHSIGAAARPLGVYGSATSIVAEFYNDNADTLSLVRLGTLASVSTSNLAGFEFRLMSSTSERSAARITAGFTDTTDATRTASLDFIPANNAVFTATMRLVGAKLAVGGNFTPATTGHFIVNDAVTNAVTAVMTLGHDTSGTAAAAFGASMPMQLESSTTADIDAARLRWYWNTATHASRKAYAILSAYDTAERDVIGWGASGTAGLLGFFPTVAAAPVVQQTSGANLTNNVTSGGTDDTIANYTDLVIYANDAATIRNDIYQLARKLKQVNDGLRAYGLLT